MGLKIPLVLLRGRNGLLCVPGPGEALHSVRLSAVKTETCSLSAHWIQELKGFLPLAALRCAKKRGLNGCLPEHILSSTVSQPPVMLNVDSRNAQGKRNCIGIPGSRSPSQQSRLCCIGRHTPSHSRLLSTPFLFYFSPEHLSPTVKADISFVYNRPTPFPQTRMYTSSGQGFLSILFTVVFLAPVAFLARSRFLAKTC